MKGDAEYEKYHKSPHIYCYSSLQQVRRIRAE